jgi:hypothetical protein
MFTPVSAFTAAKLSRNSIAMNNFLKKKKKNKNQGKLYVVIINKN